MFNRNNTISWLALYGTELDAWPEALREAALSEPGFAEKLESYRRFESRLAERHAAPPRPGLEGRIMAVARARQRRRESGAWLPEALGLLTLRPAFSVAAVLALGFLIGFHTAPPGEHEESALQTYVENDGGIL